MNRKLDREDYYGIQEGGAKNERMVCAAYLILYNAGSYEESKI